MGTSDLADLDAWLPEPMIRTRHRRAAACNERALFDAASAIGLGDTGKLGRLVRWRIPGTPADITFRELLARDPFTVLDEGPTWSVSGLAGRIWTLQRDYARLDGPEEFAAWSQRGTCRVAFAHWVEPDPDGDGAVLHHEARIHPVDFSAAVKLRALWSFVSPWEKLIGREALALATRRAERSPAPAPQAG